MKKLDQKGVGTLEVMLLIVVIALIGGVGYYVFKMNKDTNKTLDNANKSSSSTTASTQAKSGSQQTQATDSTKYLTITELGIKLPLTDVTKTAYYYTKDGYAYLSTTQLKDKDPSCAANETSIAAISKSAKTAKYETSGGQQLGQTNEEWVKANGYGTTIGDYTYIVTPGQAACSSDEAVQSIQTQAVKAFTDSATSIVKL